MKIYLIIKNYRNINPIIIDKENRNIFNEEKYVRYYLGSIGDGDLIINIGQNGIGKSNILDAVNDFFTSDDYKYNNKPRIESYTNCIPELELMIELDNGNKYKLNKNNTLTEYEDNENFDDEFISYYLKYFNIKNRYYISEFKIIFNYLKYYMNITILTMLFKLYYYEYRYSYYHNNIRNIQNIYNYVQNNHTEKEVIEYIEKIYNGNTGIQTINIDIDTILTKYDTENIILIILMILLTAEFIFIIIIT